MLSGRLVGDVQGLERLLVNVEERSAAFHGTKIYIDRSISSVYTNTYMSI